MLYKIKFFKKIKDSVSIVDSQGVIPEEYDCINMHISRWYHSLSWVGRELYGIGDPNVESKTS